MRAIFSIFFTHSLFNRIDKSAARLEKKHKFNANVLATLFVGAVIIGDLGKQWTFNIMNNIFRLLIDNPQAKLIALGMTRYWKTTKGLQLDVGPMIKAFEYATGVKAIVTGKPAVEFFQAATALLDNQENIVMIGDDIRGDIRASQDAGLTAIQVRTGKFTEIDLRLGITPDAILDSIALLPEWWKKNM